MSGSRIGNLSFDSLPGLGMPQQDGESLSAVEKLSAFRSAFWKFLRPHTIRGTILGASAVTARALLENQQARFRCHPNFFLGHMWIAVGKQFAVCDLGRE